MMQTEGTRMTAEDRQELERKIKELEAKLDTNREEQRHIYGEQVFTPEVEEWNKELRHLRRLR